VRDALRHEQRAVPSSAELAAMAATVRRALDAPSPPAIVDSAVRWPVSRVAFVFGAATMIGAGLLTLALNRPASPDVARELRGAPRAPAIASGHPQAAGADPQLPNPKVATPSREPHQVETPAPATHLDRHRPDSTAATRDHAEQRKPFERPPRAAAAAPPPHRPNPMSPDAANDLALLLQARRALVASAPSALLLLEQHARDYPNSAFIEEREALTIETLKAQLHHDQAARRARRFLGSYPDSAYRRRIEALLATP
jgi:hypothetical protein